MENKILNYLNLVSHTLNKMFKRIFAQIGVMMKAFLILEDGTVFEGTHIGANKEVISEIVFNTSMAGYLEVLTDPSYAGQAVCMTYPLIGNYGVCREDMQSRKVWTEGFIVRELSRIPSNFRCDISIQQFLEEQNIAGIAGIDTRELTKMLREKGTMNGMITTKEQFCVDQVIEILKNHRCGNVVEAVTSKQKYIVKGVSRDDTIQMKKVALLDFGAKDNIAVSLAKRGCDVTVYPADTKAEEILKNQVDGIMLSNGPGDPKECVAIIEQMKLLYESNTPIFAICLGHQLMALAAGADTFKLKYGHRGGNHPVKDLRTGKVFISSQNHGYVVDTKNLSKEIATEAFINVNDNTNEGLIYTGKNIVTVQFHPEACPGPEDLGYLFDCFMNMMDGQVYGEVVKNA